MITDTTERVWYVLQSGPILDILSQTGRGQSEVRRNNLEWGSLKELWTDWVM